jgi:hypothetical protein
MLVYLIVYLQVYGEDPWSAKLECMKDKFIIKDKKMHPVVKMNFLPEMAVGLHLYYCSFLITFTFLVKLAKKIILYV